MRESCLYGSVRGDRGNPVPYRDNGIVWGSGITWRACGMTLPRAAGRGSQSALA